MISGLGALIALAGKEQRDNGVQVCPVSLAVSQSDMAIQTAGSGSDRDERGSASEPERGSGEENEDEEAVDEEDDDEEEEEWRTDPDHLLVPIGAGCGRRQSTSGLAGRRERRRSVSLNDILGSSFVHESPLTGERIIISRGWPANARPGSRKGPRRASKQAGRLEEEHKRRLLMEFLQRAPASATVRLGDELELESALKIRRVQPANPAPTGGRDSGGLGRRSSRAQQVHYELPARSSQLIQLPN